MSDTKNTRCIIVFIFKTVEVNVTLRVQWGSLNKKNIWEIHTGIILGNKARDWNTVLTIYQESLQGYTTLIEFPEKIFLLLTTKNIFDASFS